MLRAIVTPECRPAAFGEVIIEVQLHCRPNYSNFRGKFLVGFGPTISVCTGARVCVIHFLPPRRKRKKKEKSFSYCINFPEELYHKNQVK
ncbi:hypothetical protein EVAR_9248_1 [Eumeta japonica]|uniref:Uncharacterized protein n=1 Tax=Eumeta variegata TaxID=151549 RepID=A0A4C1TNU3_EUMVA|nr:hypothetical protein EVAR_9248_1 [Eumeta japonica]